MTRSGCIPLYEEPASGKSSQRVELEHCRKALRAGDTLVVWRLDRLGRSLSDLVKIIGDLEQGGITFESLSEKIDTGSASGKLQFHVFAALAEFERNLIRERTLAALTAARARGRVGGRKLKLNDKQIREIRALLADPAAQVKTSPRATACRAPRFTNGWVSCSHENSFDSTSRRLNKGAGKGKCHFLYQFFDAK